MHDHTLPRLVTIAKDTLALRTLVRSIEVRREHIVADLGAIELACQVITHSMNAALIYAMNEGDGVQVNIRAAFEAAQDLSFLVHSGDYDYFGSRLQAAEIIDRARAVTLGKEYEVARDMEPDAEDVNVEARFAAEIEIWARFSPHARETYDRAVDGLHSDRAKRRYHWSGLTRDQMVAKITEASRVEWLPEWNRATYTFLSLGTHPSAGTGPADVTIPDIGRIGYVEPSKQERDWVEDLEVDCLRHALTHARIALAIAFNMEAELAQMMAEFDAAANAPGGSDSGSSGP